MGQLVDVLLAIVGAAFLLHVVVALSAIIKIEKHLKVIAEKLEKPSDPS